MAAADSKSEYPEIPVNTPLLNGNEKAYLLDCIESGWISSFGPYVTKFEKGMASFVGRKHAIAVCNGTAAIDVAIAALNIQAGDEVIMPTFTIISCALELAKRGAVIVPIDCDETYNIDVTKVEAAITPRTKAIMAVHIYHFPVDMEPLVALCSKHNIYLIEDAAEAIGQTYRGKQCGSFGHISCMSFYPNKHITTGEGGMVLCDDDALAERCSSFRNLCFQPPRRFVHSELGWNDRITSMQAALGLAQLEKIDATVTRKREIGALYTELLTGCPGVRIPAAEHNGEKNIYWVFAMEVLPGLPFDGSEVEKRLAKKNIGTRPFFWNMHEQPVLRKLFPHFESLSLPIAERIARRGFYIPSGLGLTNDEIKHVARVVREVMTELVAEAGASS